jgi:hypothetical protein
MGDSLGRKPAIGDAETAGLVDQPTTVEVADDKSQLLSPVKADMEVRPASAQEAVTERIFLRSGPPAAKGTSHELEVPDPLDMRRVLAKGSYVSSQVGLLLSKNARIRSDLLVACRHGVAEEDITYAGRVAEYLKLTKEQLELRNPNLPVIADLLLQADRSLVWLQDRNILLQRCKIILTKLQTINPKPDALIRNLDSAQKLAEKSPSTMSDEAVKRALIDAIIEIHVLERQDIVEEDLQARRLKILIWYLTVAIILLLGAIPLTTTVVKEPTVSGKVPAVIWPILYNKKYHPWALMAAAFGLAIIGAVGGMISGMLNVRHTRASLASYRASVLNLAVKPLAGALAALVLCALLSWNVIRGLEVTNPGVFLIAAFLAGFSERYFLRIVGTVENEPGTSSSAKKHPEVGEAGP